MGLRFLIGGKSFEEVDVVEVSVSGRLFVFGYGRGESSEAEADDVD